MISKQIQKVPFHTSQKDQTNMASVVPIKNNNNESTKERFKKYKSLSQNYAEESSSIHDRIQQIFSGFTYTSFVTKKDLKLSLTTDISKISSILSLSEMTLQKVDSFQTFLFLSDQQQQKENQIQLIKQIPQPIFEQNHQKPLFMRDFNRLNSKTPNIYHPTFKIEQQYEKIKELIQAALQSIHTLYKVGTNIVKSKNQSKKLCVLNKDHLKIKYFVSCGWQKQVHYKVDKKDLNQIKNYSNFSINTCYLKKCGYKSIFYQLNTLTTRTVQLVVQINRLKQDQLPLQIYKLMRSQLMQIQQKLQQLSNLLYYIGCSSDEYPRIYYLYLSILNGNYDYPQQNGLNPSYIMNIYEQFKQLWRSGQVVTCSQIGKGVFSRLQRLCRMIVK